MSSRELKTKIFSIVESHSSNEEWLARIYEILESGEKSSDSDWWNALSNDQKARIDQSIAAGDRGEFTSNKDVMNKL